MELKSRLSMSLGWVLASWIILFVGYFMRLGLHPFVDGQVYVTLASLATVILLLPEWLASRSSREQSWHHTHEFFTILVVVAVSVIGLLFGRLEAFVPVLARGFWAVAAVLVGWAVIRGGFKLRVPLVASTTVFGVLFVLDLYHTQGVTPHFYERMVLGSAFIDTLVHAATSNMIATQWVSSVGLDGLVPFNYHWGSHALLGGFINIASTDAIAGYNIAYPAIFQVLLFKSMVDFVLRIGAFYGQQVRAQAAVLVIFGVMLVQLFVTQPYLWMESTSVANVFMFLFLGVVLAYSRQRDALDMSFVVFSVVLLVMLAVLKISHGFVLVCALGFVALRLLPSIRTLAILGVGGLIVLFVVLFFVYPVADTSKPDFDLSLNALIYYIAQRLKVFWSNAGYPWSYVSGLAIALTIWARKGYFSTLADFRKAINDRKTIEMEALLVLNLAGLGGALYVSEHGLDVFFFLCVQFIVSVCYLGYRVAALFSGVQVKRWLVVVGVFAVLGIGASTKGNVLDLVLRKSEYASAMSSLDVSRKHVFDLMVDLKSLRREYNPRETAIYIAQKEHWYHGSQDNSRGAPFLVPSVSGIVSIGGISELVWFSSNTHYGYDDYRMLRPELIYETSEAVGSARGFGYKRLVVYSVVNNELVREVIEL